METLNAESSCTTHGRLTGSSPGLEWDLGGEVPVHSATRCCYNPPQPGDRGIPRQHNHGSPVLVGDLAPPDFAS